jgi:hypothetical protein
MQKLESERAIIKHKLKIAKTMKLLRGKRWEGEKMSKKP